MRAEIQLAERRLPATVVTLVTPSSANGAAVILAHGGTHDGRRSFEAPALALARAGYTVALPATRMSLYPDWASTEASIRQATVVHHQTVDLLVDQPQVDPARLGYYGHSLGAFQGAVLLAREQRLTALVLAAFGSGTARRFACEDFAPDAHYLAGLSRYDPATFLAQPHRVPVMLQFGERDDVIRPEEADALSAAARPPVITRWYDCDHGIDADPVAQTDRRAFFDETLG